MAGGAKVIELRQNPPAGLSGHGGARRRANPGLSLTKKAPSVVDAAAAGRSEQLARLKESIRGAQLAVRANLPLLERAIEAAERIALTMSGFQPREVAELAAVIFQARWEQTRLACTIADALPNDRDENPIKCRITRLFSEAAEEEASNLDCHMRLIEAAIELAEKTAREDRRGFTPRRIAEMTSIIYASAWENWSKANG